MKQSLPAALNKMFRGARCFVLPGDVEMYDLTDRSYAEMRRLLHGFVDAGYLLHATNVGKGAVHAALKPYKGTEIKRKSGMRFGVYATDNVEVLFAYALLDRKSIARRVHGFVAHFGVTDTGSHDLGPYIQVDDPEILRYIVSHHRKVFTDGYVMILDRSDFMEAADAPGEYFAPSAQKPLFMIKIGAHMAGELFVDAGERPTLSLLTGSKTARQKTDWRGTIKT